MGETLAGTPIRPRRIRRPPGPPEIPACWAWAPPTAEKLEAMRRRMHAEGLRYAGGYAADPGEVRWALMIKWMRNRCATCGRPSPGDLVQDHDHATGLFRGFLCRACNTSEGYSGDGPEGLFGMYRQRTPAIIFNIKRRYYSSWG